MADVLVLRRRFEPVLRSNVAPAAAERSIVISAWLDCVDSKDAPRLRREPDVEAIAPIVPMRLTGADNGPELADESTPEWGIVAVGADESPLDGSGVVAGVVDTGIREGHDAFSGIELVTRDFTTTGTEDPSGHGTHVAGSLFGQDVGGRRIGVARGIRRALIAKVLDGSRGSSEGVVRGLLWAFEGGANVITCSFDIDFVAYLQELSQQHPREVATSMALDAYLHTLRMFDRVGALVAEMEERHQPCLIFAAAGDRSRRNGTPPIEISVMPPAVSSGFVSVGSLRKSAAGLKVSSRSNTGVAIAGPGVGIVSAAALPDGVNTDEGTSCAVPHVAGVAALWAQKLMADGALTRQQWLARVLASATASGFAPGEDPADFGAGIARAPLA
jgi:subtilisin family serine protease